MSTTARIGSIRIRQKLSPQFSFPLNVNVPSAPKIGLAVHELAFDLLKAADPPVLVRNGAFNAALYAGARFAGAGSSILSASGYCPVGMDLVVRATALARSTRGSWEGRPVSMA